MLINAEANANLFLAPSKFHSRWELLVARDRDPLPLFRFVFAT